MPPRSLRDQLPTAVDQIARRGAAVAATKANAGAVGIDPNATNLGSFTSPLIDDNQSVKAALESIGTNLAASGGSANVGHILDGSNATARTEQSKLREATLGTVTDINPAAGGGESADTTAIANAFSNRETAGKPLRFAKGTYITAQQTRTVGTSFIGDGPTVTTIEAASGLAGPMLNMTYASSFFYGDVGGFTQDMSASPTRQAMFMNDVHRTAVHDIATISGAGIKIAAGGDMRLSNIFALDPTEYGIVFDGDIGSEQYTDKSLVRVEGSGVTLEAGYAVERTTSADTGGFYFHDTRVTRGGGTINNGYLFEGTNATAPSLFAFCHRTVADNINGSGAAYNLIKVKDCFLVDGFGRGSATGGAVRLENTQDIYVAGMDLDNGSGGKLINFIGTEVRPMSVRNKMVQGTAYHFGPAASVAGFVFDDIFTSSVTLTNDGTKLAASMTEHQYRSAFNVVTHPSGGVIGCFNLYDPINNKRVPMRASNGNWQVFNSDFSPIFSLNNDGLLNLESGVSVGGQRVVGARNTGWTAMTGTGSKGALAAAAAGTASAAYVQAELQTALNRIAALEARMKSYDDALFTHGLLGA